MKSFLRIKEMTKKLFILILLIPLFSCQTVTDALQGKKYESSDEFLVIKKNPLVLPPDFTTLPEPEDPVKMSREQTIEAEIDDILSTIKKDNNSNTNSDVSSNNSSTEDFVLDKIKD
tara:strand:- start:77 stop:427 length:351 start_codon:yes stop_codon:yes gene_type:complete